MGADQDKIQILVPIDLNYGLNDQVTYAENLAKNISANLRYLHVLTSEDEFVGNDTPRDKVFNLPDSRSVQTIREAFTKIHTKVKTGVDFVLEFRQGRSISSSILDYAKLHKSDIILCAVSEVSHRVLPEGLSTVLSVMAHSPIPILVKPLHSETSVPTDGLNILIADDLGDHCNSAVIWATDFSCYLEKYSILHAHVVPVTRDQYISSFYEATCEYEILSVANGDPAELYEERLKVLQTKLETRINQLGLRVGLNTSRYQTKILTGAVDELISLECERERVDLVVFGRHHFIHSRPFSIGKLSYRSMLEQRHPIIVIPSNYTMLKDRHWECASPSLGSSN